MIKIKRIIVLVSGGGTNLQAIIDAKADGKITNGEIVGVISSKSGVKALERAEKASIPAYILERKQFSSNKEYSEVLLSLVDSLKPDIIVLAGFMVILDKAFIKAYPNKIINVHPSLIPSFCGDGFYGLKVHEAALEKGVKVTGATVHFVNEITDGGKIIAQKAVEVKEDDTPETLQKRVMIEAEWKILPEAINKLCNE